MQFVQSQRAHASNVLLQTSQRIPKIAGCLRTANNTPTRTALFRLRACLIMLQPQLGHRIEEMSLTQIQMERYLLPGGKRRVGAAACHQSLRAG
jgi:hypothetical protein